MRKKIEEELAKLAFGDLSAADASRLELRTQNDPEAATTFETYRRMKEELQMLGQEVPEDQLSKERLRQAILTRGLKHSNPVAPRIGWMWMPVAAAVIAFGAFYLKGNLSMVNPDSAVVFDESSLKAPDLLPEFKVTVPQMTKPSGLLGSSKTALESSKPATQVAMNVNRRVSRSSMDVGADRHLAEVAALPTGASGLRSFDASNEVPGSYDEPLNFGAPGDSPKPAASAPTIIVIQAETDANTGALKATEVGDPANVLVGG